MSTTTKNLVFDGSWGWLFFWAVIGGLTGWLLMPIAIFYYLRRVRAVITAD